MRTAFFIFLLGTFSAVAAEIAPVASYFQFESSDARGGRQAWELWVVRPQVWDDGIPREVEILTAPKDYASDYRTELRPLEASRELRQTLFATNRLMAELLLRNVYEFRLKSVLRDYGVAQESELPGAIREELASIRSGKRAFAVLQRPGGFDVNLIELTIGVAYDEPGGLLTERRLKGRAKLADGSPFTGLAAIPAGPHRFLDRDFNELGRTGDAPKLADRVYEAGARAELTTFAKSDKAAFDLVPAIHRFLVTLGVTRFGLNPLEAGGPESPVRYRRISQLSVEAIGFPGGKNPLSTMYRQRMGFEVTHRIPNDPDFPRSSTDILEMSAERFERELAERLGKRPGQKLLEAGEIMPKYIHFGDAPGLGHLALPLFFLQPSHERFVAHQKSSCSVSLGATQAGR